MRQPQETAQSQLLDKRCVGPKFPENLSLEKSSLGHTQEGQPQVTAFRTADMEKESIIKASGGQRDERSSLEWLNRGYSGLHESGALPHKTEGDSNELVYIRNRK